MRPRLGPLVALGLVLALVGPRAAADSWFPFRDFRVVSPDGGTYAVVRATDGGVVYEVRRRRDGAAPLGAAFAPDAYGLREGEGGPIDPDPEDPLAFRGTFDQQPLEARVLDRGRGLLLIEQYGSVGSGVSLAFAGMDGRIVFRHRLGDLFKAATIRTFRQTVSSTWWMQGVLVDDAGLAALLVAHGDLLRHVSLASGKVRHAEPEEILAHLGAGLEDERALALEVAGRLKPKGLSARVHALAEDVAAPLALRLRAAVALKRAGGPVLLVDLFRASVSKDKPADIRGYATTHLGEVLGEDALPLLRDLMRGAADDAVWHAAQTAFASLGEAAVETLVGMLLDEEGSPDQRGGAAHALGRIGSPHAVDALLEATGTAEDYTANAAVNAAIATGAPDLSERLAAILLAGSTQDARIASYFLEAPAEHARAALEAARKRWAPGSYERGAIEDALARLGPR